MADRLGAWIDGLREDRLARRQSEEDRRIGAQAMAEREYVVEQERERLAEFSLTLRRLEDQAARLKSA